MDLIKADGLRVRNTQTFKSVKEWVFLNFLRSDMKMTEEKLLV